MSKRIVIALGGNALQTGNDQSAADQMQAAAHTARQLVQLIKAGHELVITHGNGPQVGTILLNEESNPSGQPSPLDTCSAMSQGQIGYWLQQALTNELRKAGSSKQVAAIVTQTLVNTNDPAFNDPTKPIGSFYPDEVTARAAAAKRQFVVKEDAGRGWRRVVASPKPIDIIEKDFVLQAIAGGAVVIAGGGGGIPVSIKDGQLFGIEAVIDKDFTAAKLAEIVDADILLILTGVDHVEINYGTPNATPLPTLTPRKAQEYIDDGQFPAGSMLPKIQAALQFAESNAGKVAIITSATHSLAALEGERGTTIRSA